MAGYDTKGAGMAPRILEVFRNVAAIVPTDGLQVGPFMALMCAVAGNIALVPTNSVTPVVIPVVAGVLYRIAFQGVQATGTTATGIIGLG